MMTMDTECFGASKMVLENEVESQRQRLQVAENEASMNVCTFLSDGCIITWTHLFLQVDALRVQLLFTTKELTDLLDSRNREVALLQRQLRTAVVCGNTLIGILQTLL